MIRVKKRLLIIVFTMLMAGCASVNLEPYRVPDSIASYAIIKDRPLKPFSIFQNEFVHIVSIDRKRVDSQSRGVPKRVLSDHKDLKMAIVLAEGVRKLHVEACKGNLGEALIGGILTLGLVPINRWYCASSVLRLEARPGFQYRVKATVNREDDPANRSVSPIRSRVRPPVNKKIEYADFWIENIETGDKVTEPIRVTGVGPPGYYR